MGTKQGQSSRCPRESGKAQPEGLSAPWGFCTQRREGGASGEKHHGMGKDCEAALWLSDDEGHGHQEAGGRGTFIYSTAIDRVSTCPRAI